LITAIVAAAGLGERFGNREGKQFSQILGKPLLFYTLKAFHGSNYVEKIILVVNKKDIVFTEEEIVQKQRFSKVIKTIGGGKERQDSINNGIKCLPKETDIVAIHDGARALVKTELINKMIELLNGWDGIVPGLPVTNTLKHINNGKVVKTLKRENIWEIQTPQVFRKNPLLDSYKKAYLEGIYKTDDAGLLEQFGYEVGIVRGDSENIKVTYPRDIYVAEAILKKRGKG
jgi:2-C-methyl-D-erythritol 4-phosphate cytidylyltransferase